MKDEGEADICQGSIGMGGDTAAISVDFDGNGSYFS